MSNQAEPWVRFEFPEKFPILYERLNVWLGRLEDRVRENQATENREERREYRGYFESLNGLRKEVRLLNEAIKSGFKPQGSLWEEGR